MEVCRPLWIRVLPVCVNEIVMTYVATDARVCRSGVVDAGENNFFSFSNSLLQT